MFLRTLLILLSLGGAMLAADDDGGRILFNFENVEAAKKWQSVNDGVMGGRSDGQFKITDDKKMEFSGTLSLENNGGFASVRASGGNLGLKADDVIVARVRGDGLKYNFNLYVPRPLTEDDSESASSGVFTEPVAGCHQPQKHQSNLGG